MLGRDLGLYDLDGIRAEMARLPRLGHGERDWPEPARPPDGSEQGDGRLNLLTYPLLLDRGVISLGADDMLKTAKQPFAALNQVDARRLGVQHGQVVTVGSDHGRMSLVAVVEQDVAPGVVYVPSNSTDSPAATLVGEDGSVRVTVEPSDEHVTVRFRTGLPGVPGGGAGAGGKAR